MISFLRHWFIGKQPILVYTPGKVGSSTVHHTLLELHLKDFRVYHLHFLNPVTLQQRTSIFISKGRKIPKHLQNGMKLSKMMQRKGNRKWKVITVTRDHYTRLLSDLFQQLEVFPEKYTDLFDAHHHLDPEKVVLFMREKLRDCDPANDYLLKWFRKELQQSFNLDIYQVPFDHSKGYGILESDQADLLVLRMEDLDRVLPGALKDFLSLDRDVRLVRSNVTTDKKFAGAYNIVKEKLAPPEEYLARIRETDYYRKFYAE
jgi:hypothetical protein